MFISQFLADSGRAAIGEASPVIQWLELALNSRVSVAHPDIDRFPYARRSVLAFGNTLFRQSLSDFENSERLVDMVKQLLAFVAPGVLLLSVERHGKGGDSDFELKFDMNLDLSQLGGPQEIKVGAKLAVSSQRVELE